MSFSFKCHAGRDNHNQYLFFSYLKIKILIITNNIPNNKIIFLSLSNI